MFNIQSIRDSKTQTLLYVDATYHQMVAALGEPNAPVDADKQWHAWTVVYDGVGVEVYDYGRHIGSTRPASTPGEVVEWHVNSFGLDCQDSAWQVAHRIAEVAATDPWGAPEGSRQEDAQPLGDLHFGDDGPFYPIPAAMQRDNDPGPCCSWGERDPENTTLVNGRRLCGACRAEQEWQDEQAAPDPRLRAVNVRVEAATCYADDDGRFVPARCNLPTPDGGRCDHVITHEVSETAGCGTGYTRCCVWHLDDAVKRATELATASALRQPDPRCRTCGTNLTGRKQWPLTDGGVICTDCTAA